MNPMSNSLMRLYFVAAIAALFFHSGHVWAGAEGLLVSGEASPDGCTIGVANGHVTVDGRPIMWKVRDWNGRQQLVYVPGAAGYPYGYIGIRTESAGQAGGLSVTGVATGNSAVGDGANFGPMDYILGNYTSLEEIRQYWQSAVKSGQCSASGCFPFIDAQGNAVMFEIGLSDWLGEYDSSDPDREAQGLYGFVVRANEFHGRSDGTDDQNIGGRYASGTYNVLGLIDANNLSVQTLIQGDEGPNCGYEFVRYGPGPDRPLAAISRDTNVSTWTVHGVLPGEDPALTTMWVILGQSNYGIAVPAWVKVSEIPAPLASGDMYDRATSLWTKRNEAATQASVFPLEAHLFDAVLDTLLPRWRANGVSTAEMKRVEHRFAADAYSLLDCLDRRQADNKPPQVDFDVFSDSLTFAFALAAQDVDGSIASITWDFGDGHTSTEHSPSHTYALAGDYLISCTITDDDGVSVTQYRSSVNPMSLPAMSVENARTKKGYASIAHAIWEAEPGDVIVLGPATYHESILLAGKAMTLRSLDPNDAEVVAATTIRGRDGIPAVTFSMPESTGFMLDGLTIVGGTVGVACCDVRPTIARCTIGGGGPNAIEFWEGYEPIIVDCNVIGQIAQVKDPGLVAHWKFDETEGMVAHDSEGENDATVVGTPLWQPQDGKIAGALQLTGARNFITTKVIRDPSTGPFSVFVWIKGGAPGQVVLSQKGGANWLKADSPDGVLATDLKSAGRLAESLTSAVVITDGNWHRVGLSWDGSNRILYVDDIEVAKDTQPSLPSSTGILCIGGGNKLAAGTFWKGLIDDVRIYDRAVKP